MTATATIDRPITATAAPTEPAILSANTYYWKPGASAGTRRASEERNQAAVASYLTALGFTVTRANDRVRGSHASGVDVVFHYEETCSNVYRHLSVTRNGANSNILAIRKIAAGR